MRILPIIESKLKNNRAIGNSIVVNSTGGRYLNPGQIIAATDYHTVTALYGGARNGRKLTEQPVWRDAVLIRS
jgi:hypothetical protein